MPRIRKKTSKRGTTNHRARIKQKVSESRHKSKKAAKKNVQWKSKTKKDPGIPNNFPYKDQILAEIAEERRQAAEEKQRRKDAKKAAKFGVETGSHDEDEGDQSDAEGEPHFDGVVHLSKAKPISSSTKTKSKAEEPAEDLDEVPFLLNHDLSNLHAVLTQADVILQVLDARDPLAYRSADIEKTVFDKPTVFILNKIDACPREAVAAWLPVLRAEHATIPFRSASAFLPSATQGEQVSKAKGKDKQRADDGLGVEDVVSFLAKCAQKKGGDDPLTVAVVGVTNSGKTSFINTLLRKSLLPIYTLSSSSESPTTTPYPVTVALPSSSSTEIHLFDTPGLSWQHDSTRSPEEVNVARARDILLRNKGRIERLKDPLPSLAHIVSRADTEGLMLLYNLPTFTKGDTNAFLASVARSLSFIKKGGAPDLTAAARSILRDWSTGKFPYYTLPPTPAASSASDDGKADELVLKTLKTRKEMRKGGGLVKFAPGVVDERAVTLEAPWKDDDESSERESDEEKLEDEDMEDESEGEEEDDDDDEGEEEEEPAPVPTGKRKRGDKPQAPTPSRPIKKVAFSVPPKESKQARRANSQKAVPPKQKSRSTSIRVAANAAKGKARTKASGTADDDDDDAYDFGKFF